MEQQEQAYLVFLVFQVYRTATPCFHPLVDHMTVLHIPPVQGLVLYQSPDKRPGLDTAVPACNQRTSDLAGTRAGCMALTFVPDKDMAALARISLVVGRHRKLALGLVVQ